MAANARFEGHLVTGHVDSVATLIQKHSDENAIVLSFAISQNSQGKSWGRAQSQSMGLV